MIDSEQMGKKMHLYVWEKFEPPYGTLYAGIAFAIAANEQGAKGRIIMKMIRDIGIEGYTKSHYDRLDWGPCKELPLTEPVGYYLFGGE